MNATKRPWHTKELHPNYGGHVLLYSNGNGLQRVDDKQGRFSSADAAYIVRAVNSYDAMREALEVMKDEKEILAEKLAKLDKELAFYKAKNGDASVCHACDGTGWVYG